jgi:ABC-type multidrug transport system fused ATPase/permease subunit
MGIISAIVTYFLSGYTFKKQENIEVIYSNMSSHYGDTFSNMPIVKSFALNSLKNKQLKKLTDERLAKQTPILIWWGVIVSFSQVLKIIVSIVVIFFGSFLYVQGDISIGEIVMFLSFSVIFLAAIEDLTWTLEGMFWRLAGIKDYFEILDTPIEVQDKVGANKLMRVRGDITFKNLEFSYDQKRTILKNINIDIQAGEKVAFV